jgi:membrane dipeptidase
MPAGLHIPIVIAVLLVVVWCVSAVLPRQLAARLNGLHRAPPLRVTGEARELHRRLFVADMHCDALMWNRDLLERGAYGHVDLPRLIEGNVGLQAFSAVTKMPLVPRHTGNRDRTDGMLPWVLTQRWPRRTWSSLAERALFQAERFHRFAANSGGKLTAVRSAADLDRLVAERDAGSDVVGGILLVEGAHALDGDIDNVDRLFDAGFRIMGLVHLFDNDVGGSMHGVESGGLTDFGRRVVRRMEEIGMIVDLAHASNRLILDVLDAATRPVVVSHTGVKGTCDTPRNLTDEEVRLIAATGGVIGIGFWRMAVCGIDPAAIVRAARHAAELVGADRVALGSDFDGAVRTPFDAGGMIRLTQAFIDGGFQVDEIVHIMGASVLRVLQKTLPRQ